MKEIVLSSQQFIVIAYNMCNSLQIIGVKKVYREAHKSLKPLFLYKVNYPIT